MRGDLELIAHADREHAERARWAARSAPTTPACCTQACRHGRDCPARTAAQTPTDASASQAIDELLDDTGLLLGQAIALLVCVVSALMYASLWL